MSGSCGSCTFCCTSLQVQELKKPSETPCRHLCGRGCGVYESRPSACSAFECLWLQTQSTEHALKRFLRPDKSRVVIWMADHRRHLIARCDPRFPGAWRAPKVWKLLRALSFYHRIAMTVGERHYEIRRGEVREMTLGPPDESGFRSFAGYVDDDGTEVIYKVSPEPRREDYEAMPDVR